MAATLQISDLVAGYGAGAVLHDLSMTFEESCATALLGANGAGKTTLLRAISGLIPRRGQLLLHGEQISSLPAEKIAARGVAHAPQGRGTFAHQTVEDNLRIGAYLRRDKAGVEEDIQRWYQQFPILSNRRRQKAGNLSGGEQQMLALARAMMSRPSLLLLDEPSLGLAPKIVDEIFEVLGEILRTTKTTVLLVEQNADRALKLADYVYVLEVGSITTEGSPDLVMDSEKLRAAYLGAQS
ncbi:ABC transporter ATP-binding protein [Alcanivorax marinus]|uniref:ABC transporter ATP-binding protein n=1 Tax=Alloalcanivorax marinus TaxID=1177169 RepID=A0A9Q3YPY7_9GAMM|nr:ABC transporter ATP-binding protein [Alloalcanivorax marinus]MCC4310426.1 ABC transporter ATP-binding protein [Alloalcanivorax marinus]